MNTKAYITKLKNPFYGFTHNVQIMYFCVNTRKAYYSGYGKFCKSQKEAEKFLDEIDEYIKEVQYIEE